MKIVLAIDDSKFFEAALRAVMRQARPAGLHIRVFYVLLLCTFDRVPAGTLLFNLA
jgi:hypothetical protein